MERRCRAERRQLLRRGDRRTNPRPHRAPAARSSVRAAAAVWTLWTSGAQNWQVNGDGTITNPQSGKCLDTMVRGTGNGTRIQIWDCYGGGTQANQVWTVNGHTR